MLELSVGYVRQSRERKDRDSVSPETQIEKINLFAQSQDSKVVKIFSDIDLSGFRIHYSKRPGLMELIEFVKENNIKTVYVYALSRVSRRIKEFFEIADILEKHGCSVISVSEKINIANPQERLFRNILMSFNEFYSDSLSTTISDNQKKNVDLLRWNGGHAPYGYTWIKYDPKYISELIKGSTENIENKLRIQYGEFVRNENFVHFEFIRDKAVEMWGVKKIANNLNARRIPGPEGGIWYSQTVKYILMNPFYRGMLQHDGTIYESPLCEITITDEQWKLIQQNLKRYEALGPRGKVSPHLLTGITKCSHCGSRFEIRYNGSNKVRRYICAGRQYSIDDKCISRLIDADSLESSILDHIQRLVESRYFDAIIEESNKSAKPKRNGVEKEIKKMEKELSNIISAQQELYQEAFVKRAIKKERFYEMDKLFDNDRENLEREIKALYNELETIDPSFIFDYKIAITNFIDIFSELTLEEQRSAIHSLIDEIKIYDDYVEVMLPVGVTRIKSASIKRGTLFFKHTA